jgi:hypothetical protein
MLFVFRQHYSERHGLGDLDRLDENINRMLQDSQLDQCDRVIFINNAGTIGARIPRMRLEVRRGVRQMRDRFKVVEWGYFISQLRDIGLTSVVDISDALHFLTNIGELSYFGGVLPD